MTNNAPAVEVVAATRLTQNEFLAKSALGVSLRRIPARVRPHLRLAPENRRGLSEIYNEAIDAAGDEVSLVFMHDDVWVEDYNFCDRILQGTNAYDVIGVAGNRRLAPEHVAWGFIDDKFTWDNESNLSGLVAHGANPFGQVAMFGAVPADCELMDGVLLAAKRATLVRAGARFDPQFDFHFYDLDFCRTARAKGLRLSTWPISITHQSGGAFNTPTWRERLDRYLRKWPRPGSAAINAAAMQGDTPSR